MTTEGMVRVLVTDGASNVCVLKVACPTHARTIVEASPPRHRFHLSPIRETDRRCDYCHDAHEADKVADWPLEAFGVSGERDPFEGLTDE